MTGGRPLRFLALTLEGWIAVRIALLLPDDRLASLPSLARALVPDVAAAGLARATPPPPPRVTPPIAVPASANHVTAIVAPMRVAPIERRAPAVLPISVDSERRVPSPYAPPRRTERFSRLAGSAWMLARGGGGGTLSGGQLGASQAGCGSPMRWTNRAGWHWPYDSPRRCAVAGARRRSVSSGSRPPCRSA